MKDYRFKRHDLTLWKANIYFVETKDSEEVIKRFNLNLPKSFEFKNYDAFVWKQERAEGGEDYYLVSRPDVKLSVLIHECVHLGMFILTDRGVDVQVSNDEPLAYLVEYLFDEANKFFKLKP